MPVLDDVRVRRALAHLYPSELVAKVVDLGLELPTTCPFWVGGRLVRSVSEADRRSTHGRRARELLDAGFADSDGDGVLDRDGAPLRLRFLMPATSVRLGKLVPLLQEQARAAGVELRAREGRHRDADQPGERARLRGRLPAVDRVRLRGHESRTSSTPARSTAARTSSATRAPRPTGCWRPSAASGTRPKRRELERALHRRLYRGPALPLHDDPAVARRGETAGARVAAVAGLVRPASRVGGTLTSTVRWCPIPHCFR